MPSSSAGSSGDQIAHQLAEIVQQLKAQNELLLKIAQYYEQARKAGR